MPDLTEFLMMNSQELFLSLETHLEAVKMFDLTFREVEKAALELKILPLRYKRNHSTITVQEQLLLFNSKIAVIGCGGMGGYVIEELSRLGLGKIYVIDHDVINEHNLNRQIISTVENIGRSKVEVVAERVKSINPAIELKPVNDKFTEALAKEIFKDIHIAVDALDSISDRTKLLDICEKMHIPLVHGSIAGWYGQIITHFPGDKFIRGILKRAEKKQGIEKILGNPSFTPPVIASLQAAEVCKILLSKPGCLHNKMLFIDLLEMKFETMQYTSQTD